MSVAHTVDAAQEVASERLAEGHNVLYFSTLNYEDVVSDMIEAIEEEGWTLEMMTVNESKWYGIFRIA